MKEISVAKNDSGQRLDRFLKKIFPLLPESLLHKAIRTKDVKVNGKRAEPSYRLAEGDEVRVYIHDRFLISPDPDRAYLSVPDTVNTVYEDENILIVNKPAGLTVHGGNGETDTLIARIQAYLYKKGEYDPDAENSFAPALCNRIDRNTSGMVIAAKNAEALRIMNAKIRARKIKKNYLLAVHGRPSAESGVLRDYLRKNSDENRVYVERSKAPGNLTAITKYRVLKTSRDLSLIEAEIVTGRTHQIRAQFSHAGFPLLGDTKYGTAKMNAGYGFKYQALVSYRLEFLEDADAGILSYLSGKKFTVTDIPFLELFGAGIADILS